jgi:hypothetical protein
MKIRRKKVNKLKLFLIITFVAVLTATPILAQENPSPTPTGNNIRDKVQEKVNAVLDNPFSYIGTVTDISGVNIQIGKFSLNNGKTNSTSEIQQIGTDDSTVFVSVGKTTKTITFDDVAIGDFVISMGYKNGNGVLEAKRILTTEALQPSGREANVFTVREIDGTDISVNKNGDSDVYIVTTKNADIYMVDDEGTAEDLRVSELEVEDKIIVVGVEEEGEIEARTIRVVSTSPVDDTEE